MPTDLTRERIAGILDAVVNAQHPRLALPNIAANNDLTLAELQHVLTGHGYPDKGQMRRWITKLLDSVHDDPDHETAVTPPPAAHPAGSVPNAQPYSVRDLLTTARQHPSKRIQQAAERAAEQLAKLRQLIDEHEEREAARRRAEEERRAAAAEVKRLEKQLAAARAKLRTGRKPKATAAQTAVDGPSNQEIRSWAAANQHYCPRSGRIPNAVRQAYDAAHPHPDVA